MGKKPPAKGNGVLDREAAHEVLLDFIRLNKMVLVLDEISGTVPSVKDHIFVVTKTPRLRVFYSDQIEKEIPPQDHKSKVKNGQK